jgi:acetyl esterase
MRATLRIISLLLLICAVLSLFAPLSSTGHWLAAALLLCSAFAALSWAWTFTADGRLDYRAALSLNLLTFSVPFKPDKDIDFKLRLPVNFLFAIDAIFPKAKMHRIQDVTIGDADASVPARVYWPAQVSGPKPPLIVYFHGGGFVLGSVAMFDAMVRAIAEETRAIVVSVDYRLAPRHPFPAAVDDAYAALLWASSNAERLGADPRRVFVAGDSAGANLSAVMCLRTRSERGPAIAGQILYYPPVDLRLEGRRSGLLKRADDYGLPAHAIDAFTFAYCDREEALSHPHISPIVVEDLANLPPALVVTAGFDPLAEKGLQYADRLEDAGVAVERAHYPEMVHGFLSASMFPQRRDALRKTTVFIEKAAPRAAQSEGGESTSCLSASTSR